MPPLQTRTAPRPPRHAHFELIRQNKPATLSPFGNNSSRTNNTCMRTPDPQAASTTGGSSNKQQRHHHPHHAAMPTHCNEVLLTWMGLCMAAAGVLNTLAKEMAYGRFWDREGQPRVMLPARLAWCTQELPSFAVPVILLMMHVGSSERDSVDTVNIVHLAMFCGHYFQRTFIFSLMSRGRPTSLSVMVKAFLFCALNGYLQSYNLLKCKSYPSDWLTDARFVIGSIVFLAGMAMNIHSDWILRNLRKPGEYVYRIPRGGLFELVSGANFLGEIVEWIGYALATWTFPAFAFAIFTIGCIGPRALHHHRYYHEHFSDYPKSRKALIPYFL